jgi:hypothetical protein
MRQFEPFPALLNPQVPGTLDGSLGKGPKPPGHEPNEKGSMQNRPINAAFRVEQKSWRVKNLQKQVQK